MDVIREPIDRRAQRNDCLQWLRGQSRNLQAVEPTPTDAHHANTPVAPGLCRNLSDDLHGVGEFAFRILVRHQPFAFAIAANVNTQAGVAALGEPRMRERVARAGPVAFAIRQVFENHGNQVRFCVHGLPKS